MEILQTILSVLGTLFIIFWMISAIMKDSDKQDTEQGRYSIKIEGKDLINNIDYELAQALTQKAAEHDLKCITMKLA